MSTTKRKGSTLRKALINAVVEAPDLPMVEVVNLILAIKKTSIPQIAKELNVSRTMPYIVLSNPRKSKRVKDALCDALGFDPWEAL
jgi:hypothetical protein